MGETVNVRLLLGINALYGSSTMSNEQEVLHRLLDVLANSSVEYDPLYDADKGFKVMPSSFHDISDIEFQENWGRVWVDLGTSDYFAIDVLLNCLTVLSSEYHGIQQIVFGGRRMGDWEEGMTSPEYGYKYFKI
ncbi:hypothetical protein GmHk_19G053611 [Glycine max]|nr:hypothetical protein GmHk_19G053611 [Glycine max]